MNTEEVIKQLKENLLGTGIYIRAQKDGKWQSVDYIDLLPEQVQEESRWDIDGWNKIMNTILDHMAGALQGSPEKVGVVTPRDVIVVVLGLLRHIGIEAKDKVDWMMEQEEEE